MPTKTHTAELSVLRATLRNLRKREAEILGELHENRANGSDISALPRPGWPIRRLSENRPG